MTATSLQTYGAWKPTAFDTAGRFLPDRHTWYVAPVMQTRDSGPHDESNFSAALDMLGGESETVEVHRFGHWGPGWFEIILVAPERAADVQTIQDRLEAYPLLDEEDASAREFERAVDWWGKCGMRERIRICAKYRVSVFAARRDEIPDGVDIGYLAE